MAIGFRYILEPEENGWQLVRFPELPEALTEGEDAPAAHANVADCLLSALEGYMRAGRAIPRPLPARQAECRVVLPSLVTAKLVVYETMRALGWSKLRLAKELGVAENSVRRLLDLRHASRLGEVDRALAVMGTELPIGLPTRSGRAA